MNAPPPFPFLTVPSAAAMNPFYIFLKLGSLDVFKICPLSLVDMSSGVIDFAMSFLTERMLPPLEVVLTSFHFCMLQEGIFMYSLDLC